jgi:peptide/nickel transport system substrate-binding protein
MIFTCRAISLALALALLSAGPALAQKKGGDLVIAQPAGTNTLDPHFTASAAARNMMLGMYETLVTIDETATPIPLLAAKWDVLDNGLTYRFELRKGVHFHTGKEMTSADVKASLERFGRVSPEKQTMAQVAGVEAPSPYVVVVRMKQVDTSFIDRLASPASPTTIIPGEEAVKDVNKTANVSTGPYQFVEWVPDSHVKLKRFDGYVPSPAPATRDGLGGRKTAYFDTITIRIVKEASARVAALESGQVQFVEDVPIPAAKRLESNTRLKLVDLMPSSQPIIYVNTSLAPTSNLKLRQAIQAALDIDEILAAATDGNYQLNPGWVYPASAYYVPDAGRALYNQKNLPKAKALLTESGYKGEPLTLMTNKDYQYMFKSAVVASEQLKALGVNVKLDVLDWPTMAAKALTSEGWNLATSGFAIQPFVGPYSYLKLFWGPAHVGRVQNDAVLDQAWTKFNTSLKQADRKDAWAQIQQRMADQVYILKLGDQGFKLGMTRSLVGFKPYQGAHRFWDVWLE